ncbi:MAG: hypothetical protein ACW964_01680, partial [Candidatus Hodarchaeales archaeon]
YILIVFILGFISTISPMESAVPDQEVIGEITIDIKHHKPQDLIISVGYSELGKDFSPINPLIEYTESKIIWNRENSEKTGGIEKTYNLKELDLKTIKIPSKGKILWFIEIIDKGTKHQKEVLSEDEKAETCNYIAGFYGTFNNVTYQSFQHPFLDDGNTVRSEIYGTEKEQIQMDAKSTIRPRALGVVCVSFFANGDVEDLNPGNGYDASAFIWDFYMLTWDDIIEPYHYYYTIDDGQHKTHNRIYTSTVDSLFATLDSVTDGNSEVIMLISSHGKNFPNYFYVYDTNIFWFQPWRYTAEKIAKRIDKITEEGTDFFLWTHCCKSSDWYELSTPAWHNYHLIWYGYRHSAYHDARNIEYAAFENAIRNYNKKKVEDLFDYADDAFYAEWGSLMFLGDYLTGYFYID